MLKILKENHLAIFDSKKQYITAYTFEIVMPDSKKKQNNEKAELNEQYKVTLHIMEEFEYTWESEYFDLEVIKNENTQFGSIPFSLDTFLELYKDPRIWEIVMRTKLDELELEQILGKVAGKLVIKTKFVNNPFILPVQSRKQNLQSLKTIKVITNAQNPGEQVFCSGQLVDKSLVDEVDVWVGEEGEDTSQGFNIYTFQAGDRISAQNICIISGQFYQNITTHRGRTVKILSQGKEVSFISNLEKTMKILKFIDTDIMIFQNVNTNIEDAYRIVFFTDGPSVYSRIFKSYLYSKIYDQWVIEGMIHYSRDNRHFQDLMQQLVQLMTEGQELFPLCNSDYSFDHVWKIKARFIYHILVNVSGSNLNDWILDFAKKRKLTSPMILKKIKDNFGKQKIKTIYEQQFITSTGMARIFYEIQYVKKDHKIRLVLRQKSLQCSLFRKYNYYRIKLEESYRLVSPMMQKIIKKNENKRNEMSGPLAVPKFLKCIPYFVGPLSIQIDGMEPMQENLLQQNITERFFDYKASSRSKRPPNKKNEQQLAENDYWMMLDAGLVFPAVYKNESISQKLIPILIKRNYESQIEELKVLNSISIRKHSNSISICKELIEKLKIKQGKENSKISVKRKILQLLPNFMGNCRDTTLWDQLLKLMELYEPVCFDYSEEGNLFLNSLLQSVGNISYNVSYSSYFQEFHRIMLAISRFHQCITEDKFEAIHRQIFKSIMKWVSKYSLQILQEACDFLELTFTQPRRCLSLIKIIVENVLPYIDKMRVKKQDFKVVRDIHNNIDEHVEIDKTGTIRAVKFHYHIKADENNYKPLQFLKKTFTQLEEIRQNHIEAYDKCLDKFKDVLMKNRDRYGLQIQLSILNENQNYFLAQYLWNQMCEPLSLTNEKIRLAWIKIYRVFYFYFTPIITMVKWNKNISTKEFDMDENETIQILENIRDFIPDIKWFSVYDSSKNKQSKSDHSDHGRRKKKETEDYRIEFDVKNIFTDFIINNPGKDSWEDLSKQTLNYLKREYENKESGYQHNETLKKQIDSRTEEKYKKIVEKLKTFIHLLKRGNTPDNLDYAKLKKKVLKLLSEAGESLELANELFSLEDKTLDMVRQQKEKRENEKNDFLKISFGSLVRGNE